MRDGIIRRKQIEQKKTDFAALLHFIYQSLNQNQCLLRFFFQKEGIEWAHKI
jgi:hypothetical protein